MSTEEYSEFLTTLPVIGLYKSVKHTERFELLFTKINALKNELYSLPEVANFKKDNSVDTQKAEEELERIFEEEF
jgi:hypothetical protein